MTEQNEATAGLDKTTAAALSYVLGPITGVVFYVISKDPFVRFHALQSIVVFGILVLVQMILGATIIFVFLLPLISILSFILWLVLIYKAWLGEEWLVPVLGDVVEKVRAKMVK